MGYLVIDLEGTCCDDNSIRPAERETIEIGAVVVSKSGEVEAEFESLVRPVRHPILTKFCTGLTGITQADVDGSRPFPAIWKDFIRWVNPRRGFCSWGMYDLDQLRRDCAFHSMPLWFGGHCNLSGEFQAWTGKRAGNRKAASILGLEPKGRRHRGLDDARNAAAVLAVMVKAGRHLKALPT